MCNKITLKASTLTSTKQKDHFITSIIRSNMNKRNSQRIYNIKQSRNVSSGMSVVQSKSTTEIASEKSLTQFDPLRSKTPTLSSRFYKDGWFHSHKLVVKRGNFDQFWRFLESFENMQHHTSPSY